MVIMVIRVMGPEATLGSVGDSPEARERLQSPWMERQRIVMSSRPNTSLKFDNMHFSEDTL